MLRTKKIFWRFYWKFNWQCFLPFLTNIRQIFFYLKKRAVFFLWKRTGCSLCVDCFPLSDVKKNCSKLKKTTIFLIYFCVLDLSCIFFSCFWLSNHVSDICIFGYGFYGGGRFFACIFRFLGFIFIVTVIFNVNFQMFVYGLSIPTSGSLSVIDGKNNSSPINYRLKSEHSSGTRRNSWWGKI